MNTAVTLLAALNSLLDERKPQHLLLGGKRAERWCDSWLSNNKQSVRSEIDSARGELPDTALRVDMAIVDAPQVSMEPRYAGVLLARLRDVVSPKFAVVAPAHDTLDGWTREEMGAFGLEALGDFTDPDGDFVTLYHYDLLHYKSTPDWLNSKYWANPERWNKDRWVNRSQVDSHCAVNCI